jgi:predicted dehydrogenase
MTRTSLELSAGRRKPAAIKDMPINLAILGLAHGHVGAYCDQWIKQPHDIRITAVWDHDATRATAAQDKYRATRYDSVDVLLARADLDAVVIGAETSLHADLVEAAAAANKQIILQKPLALTMGQADRIAVAVEREELELEKPCFTLAWQMRVDPQNLAMKHLIESAALGRIYMVRRRHGLSTHVWPDFQNSWHVKPEFNRGMWADDASHAIDFLLWLLGRPVSVSAEIATLRSEKVPDDHGIAVFRYADGTFAEVASSFTCLAGENTTEIVAENGVVIQNFGDGPSTQVPHSSLGLKWITRGHKDWTISDIPSPQAHGERIAALAPQLLKFLQGQRPPVCTADEGRTSLAMTLACYQSAAQGRRVTIDYGA